MDESLLTKTLSTNFTMHKGGFTQEDHTFNMLHKHNQVTNARVDGGKPWLRSVPVISAEIQRQMMTDSYK